MTSYLGKFVGPIVHDTPVKFRDPCLNRSREIPPKAVIFDRFWPPMLYNGRSIRLLCLSHCVLLSFGARPIFERSTVLERQIQALYFLLCKLLDVFAYFSLDNRIEVGLPLSTRYILIIDIDFLKNYLS